MPTSQIALDSLDQARVLLRELIDRQASGGLPRMLIHVENIQRAVEQSLEDPANAVRRLRDFANTIERLANSEPSLDKRDLHARLIAVLRLAADDVGGPGTVAGWTGEGESASRAS